MNCSVDGTIYDLTPVCGEDFCDRCGDCLHCYEGDPCYPDGGDHSWCMDADEAAEYIGRSQGREGAK